MIQTYNLNYGRTHPSNYLLSLVKAHLLLTIGGTPMVGQGVRTVHTLELRFQGGESFARYTGKTRKFFMQKM